MLSRVHLRMQSPARDTTRSGGSRSFHHPPQNIAHTHVRSYSVRGSHRSQCADSYAAQMHPSRLLRSHSGGKALVVDSFGRLACRKR